MRLYARVFVKILDSSLANDWVVRHVFEDALKLVDDDGVLEMPLTSFARRTNIPLQDVERAFSVLESPDAESSDRAHEGRRLVRIDGGGGWRVVNWEKYERVRNVEDARASARERQRRHRQSEVAIQPPKDDAKGEVSEPSSDDHAKRIIEHLNNAAGRRFRVSTPYVRLIGARLREVRGDVEGVLKMIDRQCSRWKGDPEMNEYLRPETLFRASKFQGYYDMRDIPVVQSEHRGGSSKPARNGASRIEDEDMWRDGAQARMDSQCEVAP